jgi:hypothetical protein
MKKRFATAIISTSLLLFLFVACVGPSDSKTDEVEKEVKIDKYVKLDMKQAAKELDEYCSGHPVCVRLDSAEYPEQNIVYDITGDGNKDLITGLMYGSGIVRNDIVVYDVYNQIFYTLGDEKNSYRNLKFENGCLSVQRYSDPNRYTLGSVKFINNELAFISDIDFNLRGIPDDLQYMWTNDSFGLEMPEKDQIKKIALYWYQDAYETDPMSFIYECIDFSGNKVVYRSSQIPHMETIEYNLLEEDEIRYLEAIDYELLTEGLKANNKWNASIEYENGECYMYNLSYEWTDKEDPKHIMLKTLFDSVEMNELDHFYAAF